MSTFRRASRKHGAVVAGVGLLWAGTTYAAGPVCRGGLYQRWHFHAGAPLAAPAVLGAHGQVTVGTHEGYLHSLTSAGAFLWSYTVEGGLLNGVDLGSGTRLLAMSTVGKIYALEPDGTPHWVFSTGFVPGYGAADPERGIYFVTRGSALFAVSSRAGFLWSVDLGSPPMTPLRVDDSGYAWFVTEDRRLHRLRTTYFHRSWPLPAQAEDGRVAGVSVAGALLLSGGELSLVDSEGRTAWTRRGVHAAAFAHGDERFAVALGERDVAWLDAKTGAEVERVALSLEDAETASVGLGAWADPQLAATLQRASIGTADGRLRVVDRSGRSGECRLSAARLFAPQIDTVREQVVVSAGNGEISAVAFEDWK